MPRRKKPNDYGTGIPYHEVEALARVLLPEIQAFFESEEGQREFAEWKAKQQARRDLSAALCSGGKEYPPQHRHRHSGNGLPSRAAHNGCENSYNLSY